MYNLKITDVDPFPLLEKMNLGFLLLQARDPGHDPKQYKVVGINPYFCQMFDRDEDFFIGKEILQLLPLSEKFSQVAAQVINTGEPATYEIYVSSLKRWLLLSIYRPQESFIAVICDDISELKRVEERLAESEKTMRVTLDVAEEGIWQWRAEDGRIYHNKKWCSIMGCHDCTSHVFDEFIIFVHPEDQKKTKEAWEKILTKHQSYFIEFRAILRDGRKVWLEDRGVPILSEEGKLERIIGSLTDVTRYKETQQQLYLEKEILQATLLSVGDILIATNVDGEIQMMNPTAERETGCKLEEIKGKNISEILRFIEPVTNEAYSESLNALALEREAAGENIQAQIVMLHTGKELSVHYHVTPIRLPDNSKAGYIIVISDISSLIERQKRITYLSYHDDLTGLYNRRYLMDALHRLDTSRNYPFTIMIMDINNLKAINDTYGHPVGDRQIRKIADFLKSIFRADDIIARTGGDEFCVLLPKTSQITAESIVKRIKHDLDPYGSRPGKISVAIGYAIKTADEMEIEEIYRQADENMYQDKKYHRNLWEAAESAQKTCE